MTAIELSDDYWDRIRALVTEAVRAELAAIVGEPTVTPIGGLFDPAAQAEGLAQAENPIPNLLAGEGLVEYTMRRRAAVDLPFRIEGLEAGDEWRHTGVLRGDDVMSIVDIAASRSDIVVDIGVQGSLMATVSGPWLTGRVDQSIIYEILKVAADAAAEQRELKAIDVIHQALCSPERILSLSSTILRPVTVSSHMEWYVRVRWCDGAKPGPIDLWVRTMQTREVV